MNTTEPHPFVSSNDDRLLLSLVEQLADEWLPGAVSCTDVDALFSAINTVVSRALSAAARKWNLTHDRMRGLPPELRDLCLQSLPTVDKCRLGAVCSFWRDTISTRPLLWSDVDMAHHPVALAAILPRSGESLLHITLTVSNRRHLDNANEVVRPHSHRLKSLHVRFDDRVPYGFLPPLSLLDYPAPSLCEVTLDWICHIDHPLPYSIPEEFCAGVAPALRSITLRHVALPHTCPALSNVSYAWIEGTWMRGIQHVFRVFPSLRRLDLVDVFSEDPLPTIPHGHPIAEVTLRNFTPSVEELQQNGYLRLRRLLVASGDDIKQLGSALRALSTSSDSSLVIGASGAVELILHRDGGCETIFSADALFLRETRDALRDGLFRDVAHLVLPLHLDDRSSARCPLLQGVIELPLLLSLQIRCGRPSACTLLDPAVHRGVIFAPLLARLEITSDANSHPVHICASHLAHFIEGTLEVGDTVPLELFIDTAHGVLLESETDLEADVADLRSRVVALHM